jgi:predicted nucleotidyltransferase
MPTVLSGVPETISAALDRMKEELAAAAGANLAGVVLFGSAARGRFREGASDVNVVVLLQSAAEPDLARIAPALRSARRAAGVVPMLMTPGDVARAAEAFPTKFLDIQRHHVVLAGADPFATLDIPRESLRLRVEQELTNLLLRLRNRYVTFEGDAMMTAQSLARAARPLAVCLQAMLRLASKDSPDRTDAIFEAAAAAFALDREPLSRMAELRQKPAPIAGMNEVYRGVLGAVARAVDLAAQMKGGVA